MKEQARRESDLIVQEAHAEGRRVMREMTAEKLRLEEDVRRIRAMLRSALESRRTAASGRSRRPRSPSPRSRRRVDEVAEAGIRQVAG